MKKKIILLGNSITAEIIYHYLLNDDRYEIVGVTIEDEFFDKPHFCDLNIYSLNNLELEFSPQEFNIIMAIGYHDINRTRERLFQAVKSKGYSIETYIHPDAKVYTHYPIGEGSLIMPFAVIEPFVCIGRNSVVWSNSTIAHHSIIGENCWLGTGAVVAGKTTLENNVFLGVSTTLVDEIIVGHHAIIGAGSLITKNINPYTVMLSRTAEVLRYNSNDYVKYIGV